MLKTSVSVLTPKIIKLSFLEIPTAQAHLTRNINTTEKASVLEK
jgi:hypothetical protein